MTVTSTADALISYNPMVRCSAENLYPKPFLTFSELSTIGTTRNERMPNIPYSSFHSFPPIDVVTVMNESTGLYTAWFEYRLKVDSIQVGNIFECKLELPSTNFIRKKRIKLIYPTSESENEHSIHSIHSMLSMHSI